MKRLSLINFLWCMLFVGGFPALIHGESFWKSLFKKEETKTLAPESLKLGSAVSPMAPAPAGLRETYLDSLNRGKELFLNIELNKSDNFSSSPVIVASQANTTVIRQGEIYKIQLFAVNSPALVQAKRKKIEQDFNIKTSMSVEGSYYKLFAGDFDSRTEAESFLDMVKNSGYRDAWIVSYSRN